MTNQMKKILMVCLILSYVNLLGMSIILILNGFVYKYVFSYIVLVLSAGLSAYFQYLQYVVMKQDKQFAEKIFYAKKLLELREIAKLNFYKMHGIAPKYNEDGTIMDPDTFIGILTKLDEHGMLEKSMYEILGIEPVFDKDGNEIPVIVVLKHLMKKPRIKDFDKIKGLSKTMKAKGTGKVKEKDTEKKKEKVKESVKQQSKAKKDKPFIASFAPIIRKEEKKKDKKSSTSKEEKSIGGSSGKTGEKTTPPPEANRSEEVMRAGGDITRPEPILMHTREAEVIEEDEASGIDMGIFE